MTDLPETHTLSLRRAVKLGDQSYSSLELREPTSIELLEINKHAGTSADIVAVSRVAGVPSAAVKLIAASALVAAAGWIAKTIDVSGFFPAGAFPDELVLPLRKAVEHDGETWTALTLREPSAGELELFNKKDGVDREIEAVSIAASAPRPVIEKALAGDMLRGMKFINSFIQGALPTKDG